MYISEEGAKLRRQFEKAWGDKDYKVDCVHPSQVEIDFKSEEVATGAVRAYWLYMAKDKCDISTSEVLGWGKDNLNRQITDRAWTKDRTYIRKINTATAQSYRLTLRHNEPTSHLSNEYPMDLSPRTKEWLKWRGFIVDGQISR